MRSDARQRPRSMAAPQADEQDMWASAEAYDQFMGRWSRAVAVNLLDALDVPPGAHWLDVGCGVGSLTQSILERSAPSEVVGVDPTAEFLRRAAARLGAPSVRFEQATGEHLPFAAGVFDAAVSGLALNFMENADAGLAEMLRVTRPGGVVAAYVWDYDHSDFFLSRLWRAATAVEGRAVPGDERGRWRLCSRTGLAELAARSSLTGWQVRTIDVPTIWPSREELWEGFLLGVGPSGAYVTGLAEDRRQRLRAQLLAELPDGKQEVRLSARALALTGRAR